MLPIQYCQFLLQSCPGVLGSSCASCKWAAVWNTCHSRPHGETSYRGRNFSIALSSILLGFELYRTQYYDQQLFGVGSDLLKESSACLTRTLLVTMVIARHT